MLRGTSGPDTNFWSGGELGLALHSKNTSYRRIIILPILPRGPRGYRIGKFKVTSLASLPMFAAVVFELARDFE